MDATRQSSRKGGPVPRHLRSLLLRWYDANKRDLPWRRTRDPYRIWVSEIMLQQTRVAAVLEHYKRFVSQFPTVPALARAREQEVLTAWSGLGYYRRARMLHSAAKELALDRGWRIPRTSQELGELPGIGRYTAAAIASIAFGEPVAVVDGNVERVLSRMAGKQLDTGACWKEAQELIDPDRPGDFNQAMMELGATICLPKSPICGVCPLRRYCSARGQVATGKATAPRIRNQRNLALITRKSAILLKQRSRTESVMPGLWELPEHTGSELVLVLRVKHSIMNTNYDVRIFAGNPHAQIPGARWIRLTKLASIPLTGMSRKALRGLNLLQ
jgi:A/G-specific adenine glycosylase